MSIEHSDTTQLILNAASEAAWWDSNLIAGLGGAVIGGAISAYVSYRLQEQNIKNDRKVRAAEATERAHATAHTILHKIIRIEGYSRTLETTLDEIYLDEAKQNNPAFYTHGPASHLPAIRFDPSELAFVQMSLGGFMVPPLLKIDSDYEIIAGGWNRYGDGYQETFSDWFETHAAGVLSYVPPPNKAHAAYRQAAALHGLLDDLYKISTELSSACREAIHAYTRAFNERLGMNLAVSAPPIQGQSAQEAPPESGT